MDYLEECRALSAQMAADGEFLVVRSQHGRPEAMPVALDDALCEDISICGGGRLTPEQVREALIAGAVVPSCPRQGLSWERYLG